MFTNMKQRPHLKQCSIPGFACCTTAVASQCKAAWEYERLRTLFGIKVFLGATVLILNDAIDDCCLVFSTSSGHVIIAPDVPPILKKNY